MCTSISQSILLSEFHEHVSNQISNSDAICLDISMKMYDVFDYRHKLCEFESRPGFWCTRLCDKVCQRLVSGRSFFFPVLDITSILLKLTLSTNPWLWSLPSTWYGGNSYSTLPVDSIKTRCSHFKYLDNDLNSNKYKRTYSMINIATHILLVFTWKKNLDS